MSNREEFQKEVKTTFLLTSTTLWLVEACSEHAKYAGIQQNL